MSNGTDITRHRYYTYNANGQLTGRTLPGNMTYGYTYDAYGNLTGVNGAGGAVKWNLTGYTGRRTVSETVIDNNTSYPFVKTH
ncbi:MAG: RHS repeat protein, partial [Bacteroidaceae bacterium]|nr:RHS repeat protein [Bacteroidaceae bacterium]